MGDKNMYKKTSKLFDKEGFYIVLFVCLCIVAVTAVYMSKHNAVKQKSPVADMGKTKDTTRSTDPLLTLTEEGTKTVPTSKQPVKSTKDVARENKAKSTASKTKLGEAVATAGTSAAVKTNSSKKDTRKASSEIKLVLPVKGDIVKKYDNKELQYAKAIGQWETHEGIDIACELGCEIQASHPGKVVDVIVKDEKMLQNTKNGYGSSVVIENDDGYRTVYSNLAAESVKVKKGDTVEANEVIGTVGDTSQREAISLEGSHLHFELLKKDGNTYVSLNPEKFLK